jgi:hypothetical protein
MVGIPSVVLGIGGVMDKAAGVWAFTSAKPPKAANRT